MPKPGTGKNPREVLRQARGSQEVRLFTADVKRRKPLYRHRGEKPYSHICGLLFDQQTFDTRTLAGSNRFRPLPAFSGLLWPDFQALPGNCRPATGPGETLIGFQLLLHFFQVATLTYPENRPEMKL